MKHFRLRFLAATALLTVLSNLTAPAASAAEWQVSKVSGRAWTGPDGARTDIAAGMTINPGVSVSTGERSRVMLQRGTESMVIGPKSIVAVNEHPDQGLSTTVVERAGMVSFDVEKRNVQHFSVETPMLAAVVKGTHFSVSVGRASGGVAVARGTVEVTALKTGQVTSVTAGQQASVGTRGLSVSGPGRRAAVTQGKPRAAMTGAVSAAAATVGPVGVEAAAPATAAAPGFAAVRAAPSAGNSQTQNAVGITGLRAVVSAPQTPVSTTADTAAGVATAGPTSNAAPPSAATGVVATSTPTTVGTTATTPVGSTPAASAPAAPAAPTPAAPAPAAPSQAPTAPAAPAPAPAAPAPATPVAPAPAAPAPAAPATPAPAAPAPRRDPGPTRAIHARACTSCASDPGSGSTHARRDPGASGTRAIHARACTSCALCSCAGHTCSNHTGPRHACASRACFQSRRQDRQTCQAQQTREDKKLQWQQR